MQAWHQIARLKPRDIKAYQNWRLHQYLNRYLVPFSPYYAELFRKAGLDPRKIRRVEDLRHLPFTTKADLLPTEEDPYRFRKFILQPDANKLKRAWPLSAKLPLLIKGQKRVRRDLRREFYPIFMTFTTGRSAEPLPFFYTRHDLAVLEECGGRMIDVIGVGPDMRVVNMFPYAPHLAFWQVTLAGIQAGMMVLGTGGGKVAGTLGNLRAIGRLKAEAIIGVPGYVYHLLRVAQERGMRLPEIKTVVLGAERVPRGLVDKITSLLGSMGAHDVAVIPTYGFTEARMAMAQCPTKDGNESGYHVYPDLSVFEVVDPRTGEPVAPGSGGELVFTALDGRGSCVLRYRTGDIVRGGIHTEPCPHCGRTVPRIVGELTRVSSVKDLRLMKIKGTLVNLEDFGHILSGMPEVEEWQVEIGKKDNDPLEVDELSVYVALRAGVDGERAIREIKARMGSQLEVTPNRCQVLSLDEMLAKVGMETEMKEKRFVDARPSS